MEKILKDDLYKILRKEKSFLDKNGDIDYAKVKDSADKIDKKLIELLIINSETKKNFFKKIKDVFVFNINDFKFFLDENKVNNSYTDYENRIGLADGIDFLRNKEDVVLNFPFKDCILNGGQSNEEGNDNYFEYEKEKTRIIKGKKIIESAGYKKKRAKRKEIFFNQILARDEVDRLEDPKALINWKRYNNKGEERVKNIKRDKDEVIKENLIIKGNNLLVLQSLKKQFTEKVKLIYIDPPYNTAGNANIFTYNNKFNHSTWLTFMKNRLDVSRDLLRNDGFITITIDHNELLYIGVLADEIFGRNNRLGVISIVIKPEGRQFSKFFSVSNEFMLVYAKDVNSAKFENVVLDEKSKEKFNEIDGIGSFNARRYINYNNIEISGREINPDYWYPFYVSKNLKIISLKQKQGFIKILPIDQGVEKSWQTMKTTAQERLDNGDLICRKNKRNELEIYFKTRESQRYLTHWFSSKYNATHQGTRLLEKIIGKKGFSYPKSLYSVLDTLKIMSGKDDLILDFFAGSGTTGHAVLELNKEDGGNRKFVLIEQLDEHIEVCVERIQKILESKYVDSSFIYFELAEWNEKAKEKINKCKNLKELEKLFDILCDKYFLNYNFRIKEFSEKVIKEESFKNLSLNEQKRMFLTMLDLNQMYIQKTEMADKKFGIDDKDQKLTSEFYNEIK